MTRTATAPAATALALTIERDAFFDALGIVSRSVPAKSTLPILSNILLTANAAGLTLTASNLNVSVVHHADAAVSAPGEITLPARLLTDYVAMLEKGETIALTLDPKNDKVHLTCGRFSANIAGLNADAYPPVPNVASTPGLSMPAAELRAAFSQVVFAAAPDESRPVLSGVLCKVAAGHLTLAAADGFRLAARTIVLPGESVDMSVILPATALAEVGRLLPDDADVTVSLKVSESHAHFGFGATEVVTRLIAGAFPDYQRIIPADDALLSRVKLSREDALRAVRAAAVFARDNSNIVRISWDAPAADGAVAVVTFASTSATGGDATGTLDGVCDGAALATSFNGRYLRDALEAIEAEEVVLSAANAASPGVLRAVDGSGALYVVMPMHTQNK